MNSGNSAAIYLTDGWRLMKIVSDTRPWKAARFIFPLKSLKEDAPELSSVRRISSDRPGHLFLKKKKRQFSQVSASLLFWKVSLSGRKYFVGNGHKIFGRNFLLIRPLVTNVTSRSPGVSRGFRILNFFVGRAQGSFWGVSP